MKKDLLSISDLTVSEIDSLFFLAADLKAQQRKGVAHPLLPGKTLGMIFEKPSLRTRVTFEVGMAQLGGRAIYLAPAEIQLGVRETVKDVAKNLERWVDGIIARTFAHRTVEELAAHAAVPVINGLSDLTHPCQILADLFTLQEKCGTLHGVKVAYIGDGNNVCHSWLYGAARTGIELHVACPKGYEPDAGIVAASRQEAEAAGGRITLLNDARAAAERADVLYTDVWTSMGQETETAKRRHDFRGFQVNAALVRLAKPDVLVMHCLPAHRGEEITDEVLDGPHSIVYDEAENRLHVQKAILVTLLGHRSTV
ncbi:MAG: ornithine carbamoyltransferase [Candidatus Methylomirabilis oxygeniifera]|uniref:Ornithine carbamoyltransferase n=1 Tax=Methylomirabilis oxygeniifera TaxID=671143 RepID=D5MHR1_METO1|nr:MAG: ornithine carbamoyltransferase [Candidatus Methylomirabilis oxyfera]CBE67194.1 ornithine carbamoyltransferase (OTCase) [Candidatus Methylomirabilis oxyfera]